MVEDGNILGLIAGGGQFPLMVADSARKEGISMVAVAHYGETDHHLSDRVDEVVWIKLGQFGQLIRAFKKRGVKKALMAGSITKKRMFDNIRPDFKGIKLMSKLMVFHDDNILRSVADELAKEGIEVISATVYLPELLAPSGCLTKRRPRKSEMEDIHFGFRISKELGRLDIGQCVVVRDRTVLAVEAIDGTDATILRGGQLAREKAVVVKASKPGQDLRFDVPAVGLETVKIMSQVNASVLAIEAGKTLLFDKTDMIDHANKSRISILSLPNEVT